jgi:hypothetical protein
VADQSLASGEAVVTKNGKTMEREIVEAQVRAQRIAAGVMLPALAKERLEMLLDGACRHMDEANLQRCSMARRSAPARGAARSACS